MGPHFGTGSQLRPNLVRPGQGFFRDLVHFFAFFEKIEAMVGPEKFNLRH